MSHSFISCRAFLLACAIATFASASHAQDIARGASIRRELRGTVIDSATRQPIPAVSIILLETKQTIVTDTLGEYEFIGYLPPRVTLAVRHLGFAPSSRVVDLSRGSATATFALVRRVTQLEGVTVRADTVAQFLAKTQATSTLTAADIEQIRGQTLGETIKELPGVSVIQYGPSIAKPVVRGLHSQRIATVNAGVPQEGQQWGGEHAPEIDAFAANEIEVIRGPGTILYGSGALAGVVRVSPRPLPTTGGIGGELATNGFLNNRQGAASLLLEGSGLRLPVFGALGWRVQGTARRAGDAATPSYYLPNTGFRELDFNTAVGMSRGWGRSELQYSHFSTNLGLYLGAHVGNLDDLNRALTNPLTEPSFTYALGRPNQEVRHDLIAWHTEIDRPNASKWDLSYGFQKNDRREFDNRGFASTDPRPAFALELYTHSVDVKYRHAPLGPLIGTIGFSGLRQGNLSPGRSFLIPQYRLYTGGVFGLEELTHDRLTLTAGARYDYRYQHAYQFGAPVVVSPDETRSYSGASGSLGASFKLNDSWSLAGTAAHAWRPPNVNERFSQGVHHGTAQYEIGDTSLVSERSLNLDATLRQQGEHTRLEVSAYRNQLDGFIYLQPRDPVVSVRGTYPAYNYAQTDALITGVEITGQVTPVDWLTLYANANSLRGSDRRTGNALYDMPADRVSASARFTAHQHSRVSLPYFEIGTTQVRRQDHVPPVTIYKLPTSGYGLLNFEVGASSVTLGRVHLEPSLSVRNALDLRYRDYLSRYRLFVDEQGRDVVLRLTMPFGASER